MTSDETREPKRGGGHLVRPELRKRFGLEALAAPSTVDVERLYHEAALADHGSIEGGPDFARGTRCVLGRREPPPTLVSYAAVLAFLGEAKS